MKLTCVSSALVSGSSPNQIMKLIFIDCSLCGETRREWSVSITALILNSGHTKDARAVINLPYGLRE